MSVATVGQGHVTPTPATGTTRGGNTNHQQTAARTNGGTGGGRTVATGPQPLNSQGRGQKVNVLA